MKPGAALRLETPYGIGIAEAGLEYMRYAEIDAAHPQFRWIMPYAGWGMTRPLSQRWSAAATGRIGVAMMRWASSPELGRLDSEMELMTGASLRLKRALTQSWALSTSAEYAYVFTAKRIHRPTITLGLERAFRLPARLQRIVSAAPTARRIDSVAPPPVGVTRLSGDELRRRGVVRLADVYALSNEWSTLSNDQLTQHATVRGNALPSENAIEILLDGQPIPLSFLGVSAIDRLPIPIADIESIELNTTPALVAGEIRSGGVIDVRTRQRRATRVHGELVFGNETGDPGPFRFTRQLTRNIDRFADDYTVGGTLAAKQVAISGAYLSRIHFATGRGIANRTIPVTPGYPIINLNGAFARADLQLARVSASLSAGKSELKDLLFLSALGREYPNTEKLEFASLSGALQLRGASLLQLRGGIVRNGGESRENRLGVSFEPELRTIEGSAHVQHNNLVIGLQAWQREASVRSPEQNTGTDTRIGPFISFRQQFRGHSTFGVDGSRDGGIAWLDHQLAPAQRIELRVSASQQPVARRESVWLWRQRGYDVFALANLDGPVQDSLESRQQISIDAAWSAPALRIEGFARHHDGVIAVEQSFDRATRDGALAPSGGSVRPDESGSIAG